MKRSLSLSVALVATLAFAACGFEHATSVLAPTSSPSGGGSSPTPNPTSPNSGASSIVGVWTSRDIVSSLPSPNSCGNFQYQIASQTASSITGTFTATCGNGMVLSAMASGQVNGNNVTITLDGSGSMQGLPLCTFKITGNGTIEGNGLRIDFTKKDGGNRWPDVVPPGWDGPLQYTVWMVVNIGGRWYTSGGVEYWYGLQYSGGPVSQFAYNWYYNPQVWGPLANHQPANGEQVGFFVTAGDERVKDVTRVRERSQVVVLPFPSGGGYFSF